jgi:hypothetical protein
MRYKIALLAMGISLSSFAQESAPDAHPLLTANGSWVPVMLIIIGGMFLAAAVIGPIVHANMLEEMPPPAHSHDEPPGASHHHGDSGTINPAPEHGRALHETRES